MILWEKFLTRLKEVKENQRRSICRMWDRGLGQHNEAVEARSRLCRPIMVQSCSANWGLYDTGLSQSKIIDTPAMNWYKGSANQRMLLLCIILASLNEV